MQKKVKAELIVMGMHGKSKMRDLFSGTTLERVVRIGTLPVLMVKNKPAGPYQSIVTGVDFAPASRTALRTAMDIAPKAAFHVVHAYNVPYYAGSAEIYMDARKLVEKRQKKTLDAFLKTEIAHFKKEYEGDEPQLSGRLVQGAVYDVLANRANYFKADILTIGAHGRIGAMTGKLGGTAHDLLTDPPCDILVAREL